MKENISSKVFKMINYLSPKIENEFDNKKEFSLLMSKELCLVTYILNWPL